jgi:predicted ATP-grasp superfamily ATP-dependent carboligase
VELKQDPADGELKLIEVNPRCGERVSLAIAAGSDVPYVAYRDALGDPPLPGRAHEIGVTWINTLNDCAAVLSHYRRAERLTWRRWVRSAVSAGSHAYLAVDDPVPCLENLLRIGRRETVPFIRHLRSRLGVGRATTPGRPTTRPSLDRRMGRERSPGTGGGTAIPEVGAIEATGARAGR